MGNKALFIVLGILLIGLIVFGLFLFPSQEQAVVGGCSGGQILSIDDVNIRYSNDLQKNVIRVLFSTIPTSECLDIYLSPSKIESELQENGVENFNAQSAIRGDIDLTKKQKIFNINENQNQKFFRMGIENTGGGLSCTNNGCSNEIGEDCWASLFYSPFSQCHCFYDNQMGVGGSFQSSTQLNWETKIKIGSNPILTLNNNKLSGKISDIAFVKWAGNLYGNVDLQAVDKDVYKPFSTNQFRMVDDGTWHELNSEYDDVKYQEIIRWDVSGVTTCDSCIDIAYGFNSMFDTKTTNQLNQWIASESLVGDAEIVSNRLIIDLNSPIVYPQFTLDIDAEEVGIFISLGEPQVTCPSDFDITSGETKTVNIQLKNIGDGSGAFDYEINCNKGSQVLSPTPPIQLAEGFTKTIRVTVGLTVEEGTEEADCTFIARDLNSLEEDSCTFSYESTHQSQCIEGTKSCEKGNTELWTCLADGSYNKVPCQYGCEAYADTFRCRLQPKEICDDGIDNDGDGLIDLDDPECQIPNGECGCWFELFGKCIIPDLFCIISNFVKNIVLAVSLIFGFIGGIIAGSFTNNLMKDKTMKEKWWILLIAFIIIGGAIFYLTFILWWLMLIVLIFLGVIKFLVPGL